MDTAEHTTYREWLDLDADGALGDAERQRLEGHLSSCGECRLERRRSAALYGLLDDARVPVRQGFRSEVLAALPAAGWEARGRFAWRLPLAVAALLLVAALGAGTLGAASADGGPLFGTLGAVAGLAAAGTLAGAGLLAASWKGLGLATLEAVTATPGGLAVFAVLVVCLNLLLWSLLRRRRAAGEVAAGGPGR